MNIKYEKATKFEKISNLSCFYSVASKEVGDFLKNLWPFQKSWTLHSRPSLYSDMLYTRPLSGAEKKLSLPSLILSSLEQAAVPRIEHNSTASENMGNNSDQRKREKERSSIGCVHMLCLRKKTGLLLLLILHFSF